MLVCALCDTRAATIGRTCDPCSRRLLSQLADVEADCRDLLGFGAMLGAVKVAGDPYAYRGGRGAGPSEPADLRAIAARDRRTRPGTEPGDRLTAPVQVLADWADALRDDLRMPPGRRTLDDACRLLREQHSRVCAAGWVTDHAAELADLRAYTGNLPTTTRDRRRLLGSCLDLDCPGRVWTTGTDPACDTCQRVYDSRALALLALDIEQATPADPDEATVSEAADRFGVRPDAIRNWMQRGHVRILRRDAGRVYVSASDVRDRVQRMRPPPDRSPYRSAMATAENTAPTATAATHRPRPRRSSPSTTAKPTAPNTRPTGATNSDRTNATTARADHGRSAAATAGNPRTSATLVSAA